MQVEIIKYYCDICGTENSTGESKEFIGIEVGGKIANTEMEEMVLGNNSHEDILICNPCLTSIKRVILELGMNASIKNSSK